MNPKNHKNPKIIRSNCTKKYQFVTSRYKIPNAIEEIFNILNICHFQDKYLKKIWKNIVNFHDMPEIPGLIFLQEFQDSWETQACLDGADRPLSRLADNFSAGLTQIAA